MNYYIQGDADNADKISAAFEKLGYDTSMHLFNAKSVLYFTLDGEIRATTCNCTPAIIKTHPDYKELELPVEPKFKVGDWIVRGEGFVYEPSLITEIRDYYICELLNGERVTYTLNDVHKNFHLWTIADAKDGDVLTLNGNPFIYSQETGRNYCCVDFNGALRINHNLVFEGNCVLPATKAQRDLLFAKMREAGYEWDAEKKELKKIQHYDIARFYAGMPVLVRDSDNSEWKYVAFSHYREEGTFCACGSYWYQCIPFNEETKHLLGTTDMPSEEYINW